MYHDDRSSRHGNRLSAVMRAVQGETLADPDDMEFAFMNYAELAELTHNLNSKAVETMGVDEDDVESQTSSSPNLNSSFNNEEYLSRKESPHAMHPQSSTSSLAPQESTGSLASLDFASAYGTSISSMPNLTPASELGMNALEISELD
eukprot:TRINITY_DN1087_c0_g1_i1.p1 TRINITY_DN1087_c0_g1~~TRINITY_DN1087_c0_g1_i1.p1  ORF type:complete len:160 (+),score=24.14 TRINITY_DN1087_c0_g1_i1:37-480(+)